MMPMLDAHPIAPPSSNPNGQGARTADREWRTARLQGGLPGTNVETSVLATEGEWSGCDVYILPAITSIKAYGGFLNGMYRVKVYAVVEGVGSTLVASGFITPGQRHGQDASMKAVLAAQARGPRCKYEVTVAYVGTVSPTIENLPVSFSLVASNDLSDPDPSVGVGRASELMIETVEQGLPGAIETLGQTSDGSDWEVVSVLVTNNNAAARSLLLFDMGATGAPAADQVPSLSFEVQPGESRVFHGPFGVRFGKLGLHAGVSTDPTKYVAAAAGEVVYQVFLR